MRERGVLEVGGSGWRGHVGLGGGWGRVGGRLGGWI